MAGDQVRAYAAALRSGAIGGGDQTSAAEKELQERRLREILGLLLSAGYFRARLPGLADFDKVRPPVLLLLWLSSACVQGLTGKGWSRWWAGSAGASQRAGRVWMSTCSTMKS